MGCYLSLDKPRSVKPILEPTHDNNLVDSMSSILPSHTDSNATVNDKVRLGFVARAPQTQSLTGKLIAAAKIDDVATANELLGRYMQDADSLSAGRPPAPSHLSRANRLGAAWPRAPHSGRHARFRRGCSA